MTPIYRCPHCGSDDLRVEVTVTCVLTQADDLAYPELQDFDDLDFGDDDVMLCNECEHTGPAKSFLYDPAAAALDQKLSEAGL